MDRKKKKKTIELKASDVLLVMLSKIEELTQIYHRVR